MASGCKKALRVSLTRVGELFLPHFEGRLKKNTNVMIGSMISYPNYKFIFPIKALGMFAKKYGDPELQ